MQELATLGSIFVGIDGSKAAISAALWAADEAVSRDVPLCLVNAVEQGGTRDAGRMAHDHTAAENALRQAVTAVEATGQPVKIETEIASGSPVSALIRASASAAMVCVGAVGLRHFQPGRVGSTATALAFLGRSPVAIVRGRDGHRRQPDEIVVDVDRSPENGVLLGAAMGEALLRNAPVRAVICRQAVAGDDRAERDRDRRSGADLDRRLARWRRGYPHVEVESVVVYGSLLDYLARNHRSARLVIVGASNRPHLRELFGPIGTAMLQDANSSLLIVNRQNL
ncbi:universal stress protein [Mycobacterium sp.]|uniref:universal stress protein n=1 Tax=Mycobacterium sp. TaxID=1785 RepID=UPI003BB15700